MTFLYQTSEGSEIVEFRSTTTRTDNLTPDVTHVHSGGLFAAYVDEAFGDRTRATNTTTVVVGEVPQRVTGAGRAPGGGGGGGVSEFGTGWHDVSRTNNMTTRWVGDPNEQQFLLTIVNETLVERWTDRPGGGVVIGGDTSSRFTNIARPRAGGGA